MHPTALRAPCVPTEPRAIRGLAVCSLRECFAPVGQNGEGLKDRLL
jgi:hypothetical protein